MYMEDEPKNTKISTRILLYDYNNNTNDNITLSV